MPEITRVRLILLGLLLVGVSVFGAGIDWGLPSHQIDPFLLPATDRSLDSRNSFKVSGGYVTQEAGGWSGADQPADVSSHVIVDRSGPVVLLDNGPQVSDERAKADAVYRARMIERYRLYSEQPDEMINFRALAQIKPSINLSQGNFDPKLYQYGGLWIYPLGGLIGAGSVVDVLTVGDLGYYVDHPEAIDGFYIIARGYSMFWGLIAAIASFLLVRRWTKSLYIATAAAVCFILMPVVVNSAHEAKPHLAGAALLLLAVLAACEFVASGRMKSAIWAGILCGAAAGMVLTGAMGLVLIPTMIVLSNASIAKRLGAGAIALVLAIVVYFATNPYVAVHLLHGASDPILRSNLGNTRAMYAFGNLPSALGRAAELLVAGTSWPLMLAAIVGLLLCIPRAFRRSEGWLLAVLCLVEAVQFSLLAAAKPGEYARFGLVVDIGLLIVAMVIIEQRIKSTWLRRTIAAVLVIGVGVYGVPYTLGFLRSAQTNSSSQVAAAEIARRADQLPSDHPPTIGVFNEPAPFSLPPVDLSRFRLILLPLGSTGSETGVDMIVAPDQSIDLWRPSRTPISWANRGFDISSVQQTNK